MSEARLREELCRVGRSLQFDGKKEQFVNDKEADKLLTREYRKGFEIPKLT